MLVDVPFLTILGADGTKIANQMLTKLESIPRETEADNLTHDQCKATLFYALIKIQILFNQSQITSYIG